MNTSTLPRKVTIIDGVDNGYDYVLPQLHVVTPEGEEIFMKFYKDDKLPLEYTFKDGDTHEVFGELATDREWHTRFELAAMITFEEFEEFAAIVTSF